MRRQHFVIITFDIGNRNFIFTIEIPYFGPVTVYFGSALLYVIFVAFDANCAFYGTLFVAVFRGIGKIAVTPFNVLSFALTSSSTFSR